MPCQCANAVGGNLAPFKKHVDIGLLISIMFPVPLFYIHCFRLIVLHFFLYLCMMCMCIYLYLYIFFTGRESSTYPHLFYHPGIFRSCKSWKSVKKPSLNWMQCPGEMSGESLQLWPIITDNITLVIGNIWNYIPITVKGIILRN